MLWLCHEDFMAETAVTIKSGMHALLEGVSMEWSGSAFTLRGLLKQEQSKTSKGRHHNIDRTV